MSALLATALLTAFTFGAIIVFTESLGYAIFSAMMVLVTGAQYFDSGLVDGFVWVVVIGGSFYIARTGYMLMWGEA